MGRKPAKPEAEGALERLREARISAASAHAGAVADERGVAGQVEHLDDVVSRFVRRRDHLRAAAEASPSESSQAEELAGTAERLRQGVERVRRGLLAAGENAAARTRETVEDLARIDAAITRLSDAMKSLELVKLEQTNRDRLTALERSGLDRLALLGRSPSQPPGLAPGTASADIDSHVRAVTRLAYESEALADLQRERLA